MITIIAGSRNFNDPALMDNNLDEVEEYGWRISQVVSGSARGADRLGEEWADINEIPLTLFPAKWEEHGKSAGYIRNKEMAEYAEALVAFWDRKSKGTKHMIDLAIQLGLYVKVVYV